MIQAEQLRIGNLVLLDGKHFAKVECIDVRTKTVFTENPYNKFAGLLTGDEWSTSSDFIQPIPISSAILESCGFSNPPGSIFWHRDKFSIIMPGNTGFENGRLYFNSWFIMEAPKYLHVLMNLYFFMIGTELTIEKVKA